MSDLPVSSRMGCTGDTGCPFTFLHLSFSPVIGLTACVMCFKSLLSQRVVFMCMEVNSHLHLRGSENSVCSELIMTHTLGVIA